MRVASGLAGVRSLSGRGRGRRATLIDAHSAFASRVPAGTPRGRTRWLAALRLSRREPDREGTPVHRRNGNAATVGLDPGDRNAGGLHARDRAGAVESLAEGMAAGAV